MRHGGPAAHTALPKEVFWRVLEFWPYDPACVRAEFAEALGSEAA